MRGEHNSFGIRIRTNTEPEMGTRQWFEMRYSVGMNLSVPVLDSDVGNPTVMNASEQRNVIVRESTRNPIPVQLLSRGFNRTLAAGKYFCASEKQPDSRDCGLLDNIPLASIFAAANHTEAKSAGMWLNRGYTPGCDSFLSPGREVVFCPFFDDLRVTSPGELSPWINEHRI